MLPRLKCIQACVVNKSFVQAGTPTKDAVKWGSGIRWGGSKCEHHRIASWHAIKMIIKMGPGVGLFNFLLTACVVT